MASLVRSDLPPSIQALDVAHLVKLTVLDDMRLIIEPSEIARDAEHNSATFYIAAQPSSLDAFVCRAEVQTSQGSNHRLVVNGEFSLTSDIAVQGINKLQLVYSDGTDIIRKTYAAPFHVSGSLNAVDESDPEFQDGLGQITRAAFTQVSGTDTAATFYNIAGQEVAVLPYPPGQGGGLDEATADLLYLRLNGMNAMQGSVGILGPNRGVTWEIAGQQGAIYSTGTQLVMRRAVDNTPIVIEDNSGATGTRSPILTEAMGDARYLTPDGADITYLRRDGGQMTGPLITASGGSTTNPGLGIGDNATGFFRAGGTLLLSVGGQLYAQWLASPPSLMMTVPLNMAATNAITNLADPTAQQDAVNLRTLNAAVAGVPRPNNRVFLANEVTIGNTPTEFFNQPFFVADNASRTILVTVYPQFASGTPGAFYDLEYSISLSVGLVERLTVYPTPNGYMGGGGSACFAATVTPASSQIPIQISVREMSNQPTPLIQIGARTDQRSYVVIQEMTQ